MVYKTRRCWHFEVWLWDIDTNELIICWDAYWLPAGTLFVLLSPDQKLIRCTHWTMCAGEYEALKAIENHNKVELYKPAFDNFQLKKKSVLLVELVTIYTKK